MLAEYEGNRCERSWITSPPYSRRNEVEGAFCSWGEDCPLGPSIGPKGVVIGVIAILSSLFISASERSGQSDAVSSAPNLRIAPRKGRACSDTWQAQARTTHCRLLDSGQALLSLAKNVSGSGVPILRAAIPTKLLPKQARKTSSNLNVFWHMLQTIL